MHSTVIYTILKAVPSAEWSLSWLFSTPQQISRKTVAAAIRRQYRGVGHNSTWGAPQSDFEMPSCVWHL